MYASIDVDTVASGGNRRDPTRLEQPAVPAVIGAEHANSRDGYPHAFGIARVLHDGVEAEPTVTRRPLGARGMVGERAHFAPVAAIVIRAEQARLVDACQQRSRSGSL